MPAGRASTVLAAVSATADPACASTTGNTAAVFSVTGGALAITMPSSTMNLGSASRSAQITAQPRTFLITDARAPLAAAWTNSVRSTRFTTGDGTDPGANADSSVSHRSEPTTATTGSGTFAPGHANRAAAVTLVTSRTAFTLTAGLWENSASWNPTLGISVPAAAAGGTYTGTVTHAVA